MVALVSERLNIYGSSFNRQCKDLFLVLVQGQKLPSLSGHHGPAGQDTHWLI